VEGMDSVVKGHGGDDRHLVLGISTGLATLVFSSKLRIIYLYCTMQHIRILSLIPCLHNLVVDQPHRAVIDPQHVHRGDRRNARLGFIHQIEGMKSFLSGKLVAFMMVTAVIVA